MRHRGGALLICTGLWMGLHAQGDCDALLDLREAYLGHSTFEQAVASEALAESALSEATGQCAVLIAGHRWMSRARSADFGWNPQQKFDRLYTGLDSLDALCAKHPDLDVLKALRLAITGTAPRWLGLDAHWPDDIAALQRLLASDYWAESPKFSAWMSDLLEQMEKIRS